ncbi:hypothetical protein [Flavobacterium chungangense]|uniref:hypothetical protein n=1 Tax=Flavobacterium chungangense TaxID=554283 RepID=UPI0012FC3635|nr:hypothetical protein [Flavobacterium chungangense]
MMIHSCNKRGLLVKISKLFSLFSITYLLFFTYNRYENSYSKFILYKPNAYGEFKPIINFNDYDKVKLEKLFTEYGIEYKKEKEGYLIKNKDLQFNDLMFTISDQYFREEMISP